jgi:hypothetical protein
MISDIMPSFVWKFCGKPRQAYLRAGRHRNSGSSEQNQTTKALLNKNKKPIFNIVRELSKIWCDWLIIYYY